MNEQDRADHDAAVEAAYREGYRIGRTIGYADRRLIAEFGKTHEECEVERYENNSWRHSRAKAALDAEKGGEG